MTMPIKSVRNSSSMWPLSFHVRLHKNKHHKPSLLSTRFVWNMRVQGVRHIHNQHNEKSTKHLEPIRSERSSFDLRWWGLPPVYQTPGRRPDSAAYEGIRFLFVLCCDHVRPMYNSRPCNFNAAVMSLLWSVVHVKQRRWRSGREMLLVSSYYLFLWWIERHPLLTWLNFPNVRV